jgi:peroxiredoxin Q/BCP
MAEIQIGNDAPLFEGIDQNGKEISLDLLKGKKVILYFYPKDNTPGCTAEACDLRDNFNYWQEKGFVIIGISADNEAAHQRFAEKYTLPFSLIADTDKSILKKYGAWGEKKLYGKVYEGIIRTTFVIDENGKIIEIIKKVDTKNHSSQIIKLIENK